MPYSLRIAGFSLLLLFVGVQSATAQFPKLKVPKLEIPNPIPHQIPRQTPNPSPRPNEWYRDATGQPTPSFVPQPFRPVPPQSSFATTFSTVEFRVENQCPGMIYYQMRSPGGSLENFRLAPGHYRDHRYTVSDTMGGDNHSDPPPQIKFNNARGNISVNAFDRKLYTFYFPMGTAELQWR